MTAVAATRSARIAAAMLVVAGLLAGCGIRLQNIDAVRSVEGPSYRIVAVFRDASGLPVGGEVRLGPAVIGRVQSITAHDFHAYVHMSISDDVRLPRTTRAELKLTTALGSQYVALQPPQGKPAGFLGAGATIPERHTGRGPSIEDTLALFGTVLNKSGFAQAKTIINEVTAMLDGRAHKARALLQRTTDMLSALDKRSDEFARALNSLAELSAITRKNREIVAAAFTEIRPAIDVLRGQQGALHDLLTQVGSLADTAKHTMRATRERIVAMVDDLAPILGALQGLDSNLTATLNSLQTLTDRVRQAAPGDYLNLDVTFNLPATLRGLFTAAPTDPAALRTAPSGVAALLREGIR